VLGKHSGRHAVRALLEGRGIHLAGDDLAEVIAWVKRRAELDGSVDGDDLVRHVTETVRPAAVS
jgi:isopropylmalate/homocitrate/citramalate synthase